MTRTVTLSLVITSCGGTFRVTVRRSTRTIWSTIGISRIRPGPFWAIRRPEAEDHAALVLAQDPDRRQRSGSAGGPPRRRRSPARLPSTQLLLPLDRPDPAGSGRPPTRLGLYRRSGSSPQLAGQLGPPQRPLDEHLAHRARAAGGPRRPRRSAPPSRCAPGSRARLDAPSAIASASSPPSSSPTTITTGAETSSAPTRCRRAAGPTPRARPPPRRRGTPGGHVRLGDDQRRRRGPAGRPRPRVTGSCAAAVGAEQERDRAERPRDDQARG